MNERILEIAKQASLKFPSETDLSPPEKKFTELIVRECISVYERDSSVYHEVNIANILEHFGVEE